MECLKEVKKNVKDIFVILLLDDNDLEEIVDGLCDGYEDVVQKDDQV